MSMEVIKVPLSGITELRALFLTENNFQIRYHARHERGWSDSWLIVNDHQKIGYGSVMGKAELVDRDTVFEFYLLPAFRNKASQLFELLIRATGVTHIECQTNEKILTALLFEYGIAIQSDTFLFQDAEKTELTLQGVHFRARKQQDVIFSHKLEPVGNYVLEFEGQVVATGGFMLHYNQPFADLYMEVDMPFRKRGYGSFLIQELKNECYRSGRVPAARCNIENVASRSTLQKAGMAVCGFMAGGKLKKLF